MSLQLLRQRILNWRVVAVFLICVVCGIALYYYDHYSKKQFMKFFEKYQEVSTIQQDAAFTPAAATNSKRESLNQTLASILAPNTPAPNRVVLATQALQLIKQMNSEIDVIGEDTDPVASAVEELELLAKKPGNMYNRARMLVLVDQAQKEMATIEDIRGLSYRANFEIVQVCNRILFERGVLSQAYTRELNDKLPDVEAEFTERQNAYADLQKDMYVIDQNFSKLQEAQL